MDLPSDDALRWIVRSYARLRAAHGDAIGVPALVHPTGAFFPDEFRGDAPSVAVLLRRIVTYAPIADDLPIELAFVSGDVDSSSGCGSAACGSGAGPQPGARAIEELDDGYRVFVSGADVAHPELLTASLAASVGALVLGEAGGDVQLDASRAMAEMAAVACGFGVLLANGAAVWAKSCGGLRMARGTALSVEETAVALALFVQVHRLKPSEARANLRATQREALEIALSFTESNPFLVESLRDRPVLLESGLFDIAPPCGLLGRWLRRRRLDREMRAPRAIARTPPSEDRRRRLEEARALVDEVLGGE